MDELIRKEDALDALDDEITIKGQQNAMIFTDYVRRVARKINDLPSVQQEQLDCEDCIKHGGDWECDRVHCHKGDAISRQAAIKAICEECDALKPCEAECEWIWAVKELPSVQSDKDLIHLQKEQAYMQGYEDGKKPRKGKWIRTRTMTHDGELYCDQCEQEHPEQKIIWNFCPNCGSDMRPQYEEPEINPCRGCEDYDGEGGCKTKGGCADRRGDSDE